MAVVPDHRHFDPSMWMTRASAAGSFDHFDFAAFVADDHSAEVDLTVSEPIPYCFHLSAADHF